MRRELLIIIMCAFFIQMLGGCVNYLYAGGPKLVVDQKEYDFGMVHEGVILTHSFKIRNLGDETLKIIRVKPG